MQHLEQNNKAYIKSKQQCKILYLDELNTINLVDFDHSTGVSEK